MKNKIIDIEKLPERVKELRAVGQKLVATNGCFDVLHVGHVRYLQAARALGDALLVGVNGDESAHKLKGPGRPLNGERERAEMLAALECVDFVTIFPELRAKRFIEMAAPAIYATGGDYTAETLNAEEQTALQKIGAKIRIIPFEKGYSTSSLLERLRSLAK